MLRLVLICLLFSFGSNVYSQFTLRASILDEETNESIVGAKAFFHNTRQSNYGSTLSSPNGTPQYTDIWAPLDGFFFNAGLKIKL